MIWLTSCARAHAHTLDIKLEDTKCMRLAAETKLIFPQFHGIYTERLSTRIESSPEIKVFG